MKHLEISVAAESIARKFVENGADMNSAITKLASERDLNDEQVKRLVEESNKFAFLSKFEKTGEQIFDVASFETIKEKMNPVIEKVASVHFDKLTYGTPSHADVILINSEHSKPLEKVAEAEPELTLEESAFISKYAEYCELVKEAYELEEKGALKYGTQYEGLGLWKVATVHGDHDYDNLVILNKQINALSSELEKNAAWFEVPGKMINQGFSTAGKAVLGAGFLGAKGAAKVGLKTVGVLGPAALTIAGLGHGKVTGAFNMVQGAETGSKALGHFGGKSLVGDFVKQAGLIDGGIKAAVPMLKNVGKGAMNLMSLTTSVAGVGGNGPQIMKLGEEKIASFLHNVLDVLAEGGKSAGGFLGGITSEAARKLGGGIALTMNQRELRDSFDTIMARNPDFANKRVDMANYFDVIARHAPAVATDPVTSGNILKTFDAFGGVDLNTVKTLHDIQQKADHNK